MHKVEVSSNGEIATLISNEGSPVRYHAIWLRDNARDEETRSPSNGQRLIALRDIPAGLSIAHACVTNNALQIEFKPENKTIEYDIDWLLANRYDTNDKKSNGWTSPDVQTWDSQLTSILPIADFDDLKSDSDALRDWLSCVRKYGFAKLSNQ